MDADNLNMLKIELTELFKDGYEELYFRDSDKNDGVTERFKYKDNDKVICFILCEFIPYENTIVNLHSEICFWGSDSLYKIIKKYKLNIEWEDSCLAYLYIDEDLYNDEE